MAAQPQLGLDRAGIEKIAVDAIAQHADVGSQALPRRQARGEKFGLVGGNQQADIGLCRQPRLFAPQQPGLARIDPADHAPALGGIGFELGRIDIDEIQHHPPGEVARDILAHLPGEDIDCRDRPGCKHLPDIGAEVRVVEGGQADRLARCQRLQSRQHQRLGAANQLVAAGQRRQLHFLRHVVLVVGEGGDMHRGDARQALQNMVRADLVAAIRRKRDAVADEQDFAHQPRPLAIHGPSRLASGKGSRRQTAICSACLALVGSASRGGAPAAVQLA